MFRQNDIARWFENDSAFNELYPVIIQQMARRHWTPLLVAKKAAACLRTAPGDNILDIGSGAGKFCLIAGYFNPDIQLTGVEQRAYLVDQANELLETLQLKNVRFIKKNIKDISFRNFDHFYYYNAFYEHIAGAEKIDDDLPDSIELFEEYSYYLFKQLRNAKKGTRLATYHSMETEIPNDYHLVSSDVNNYLKFWIKE